MATASLPRIHFFRPGRHTAMSGQEIEFSEADLAAAAAAYDPAKYQAPIVVGHPAIDAPAYGWVKAIAADAGELYAEPDQVEAQFAEMVREGRYKKVSAAWYTPQHPNNPAPGAYYLKHLGFLGAAAPAVPGLKPVAFAAEADDLVIEFAAPADGWTVRGLFRRLRDWLIQDRGLETADQVIPEYAIESIEQPDAAAEVQPMFTAEQPTEMEVTVSPEQAAQLESENAQLKADLAASKAREAEAARLSMHAENAAFCEAQVAAGRLTPGMSPLILAALDAIALADSVPQFGDGDAAQPLPAALKAAIAAGPVVVDFAERSGAEQGDTPPPQYTRAQFDELSTDAKMAAVKAGAKIV
jgi:hypothetical protein